MYPFPEITLISVISFWCNPYLSVLTLIYMPNYLPCKYRFIHSDFLSYLQPRDEHDPYPAVSTASAIRAASTACRIA